MLPAPNVLLYSGETSAGALDALRNYGLEVARKSPRPLSPLLIRWTPGGWEEIKPPAP